MSDTTTMTLNEYKDFIAGMGPAALLLELAAKTHSRATLDVLFSLSHGSTDIHQMAANQYTTVREQESALTDHVHRLLTKAFLQNKAHTT